MDGELARKNLRLGLALFVLALVLFAGAIVVAETLGHFGLDTLEVSERDIMHGAALAAAELPERPEGDPPPGAYTCC